MDLTFFTAIGNWTLASGEKQGTHILSTKGLSEAEPPPPNNFLIAYFCHRKSSERQTNENEGSNVSIFRKLPEFIKPSLFILSSSKAIYLLAKLKSCFLNCPKKSPSVAVLCLFKWKILQNGAFFTDLRGVVIKIVSR